ncbi:uncharacterized protein LOC135384977 [Ornithodoros turicata]|uniref:uncharacterized protein LOC135384977 n=1 Tax=Ornithodoros turicata TaxID=34597 RepID=UPI0031391B84
MIVYCGNFCDVDSRKAMFYATAVGRATHYCFKKCMKYLTDLHYKPDANVIFEVIDFYCTTGAFCAEGVSREDVPKIAECLMDHVVANWTKIHLFDDHDIERARTAMRCLYPVLPNWEVTMYVREYFQKIIG